jgi:hypothetical protein
MEPHDGEQADQETGLYPPAVSRSCGQLPLGISPMQFLSQPPNLHKRSAEGSYAREYVARMGDAHMALESSRPVAIALPREVEDASTSPAEATDM